MQHNECNEQHMQELAVNGQVLVGISTCLSLVFPDEATRPSLRTFNEWRARGYYPYLKIGKRVFLDADAVRKSLSKKFTISELR